MDQQLACEAEFGQGHLHNYMIAIDLRDREHQVAHL
jgi:hypothetical protein